jgi:phosphonate transport system substrate-binding protein
MGAAGKGLLTACLLTVVGAYAQPAVAPTTVVEVRPGDTFSAIAARYTGHASTWRKMYRPQLSRLRDPSRITPGMRFEVVSAAGGAQYLRLMHGPAAAVAATPAPLRAPVKAAPAAAPVAAAATDNTLVIGVLPNIGAAALLQQYELMQRYLERVNAPQKVRIVVPSNFKTFFDGTMRGEFDLAVAAPHFARVAQLDRGMVPVAMYEPRINALFITPIGGTAQGPLDVRDKVVAFANPQSLVAMYGQQWLLQQKLEAGKDYQVKAARTDMGVGRMLLSGEAVAAVMSNGELRALPADESARLKVSEAFARIPNFILLAHPRLERERINRLKSQLRDFIATTEEGAAFARATGFTGVVDADDATLRELDPYTAPTRKAMGYGN